MVLILSHGTATSWRHFGSLRSALLFFYKLAGTRYLFSLELNANTTWIKRVALKHLKATKKHSGRNWSKSLILNSLNVCIPWIWLSVVRKIDHTWGNLISWTRFSAMKEWLLQQHLINPFHSGFFFFSDKPFLWSTIADFSQLHDLFCL